MHWEAVGLRKTFFIEKRTVLFNYYNSRKNEVNRKLEEIQYFKSRQIYICGVMACYECVERIIKGMQEENVNFCPVHILLSVKALVIKTVGEGLFKTILPCGCIVISKREESPSLKEYLLGEACIKSKENDELKKATFKCCEFHVDGSLNKYYSDSDSTIEEEGENFTE